MRSPISLTGSKHYQAPWIIEHLPKHRVYVEVFGGGAHVLIQKNLAKVEIYNDINNNLVNFLMIARDRPGELYEACDNLPVSRSLFEKWKWEDWPEDNLDRAVRWFYVMRQSFGGMQQHYQGDFSEKDHKDLAEMLDNIEGKAVVSYYNSELVNELYQGWEKEKKDYVKYAGSERNTGSEVLLMNYKQKMSLF